MLASYKEVKEDFGRVFVVQTNLVSAQDKVVATKAAMALAVVKTYKARRRMGIQVRCLAAPLVTATASAPNVAEDFLNEKALPTSATFAPPVPANVSLELDEAGDTPIRRLSE